MPCDYSRYPKNWKTEIRPSILRRAENKCEFCGVENYSYRVNDDGKIVRIILTIAHVYDENPMNCDPENLKALCQRCHLKLDAKLHAEHAKKTRKIKNGSTM